MIATEAGEAAAAEAGPTGAVVAIEGTIVPTAAAGTDPATIAAVDGRRETTGTIVAERVARRANGRAGDGSDERLHFSRRRD